jgi:ketol-acid reductoisomerase
LEEATKRGTVIQFLVSDAGQKMTWPAVKACLKPGDALYFSHGFGVVYADQTGIIPPADVDVIMVAPKGSGTSVRANFLDGSGINSSYAVYRHRRWLRLPVPHHFPERSLQRPDR